MTADDTIFALSSGSLPAGVAVVRISGPAVRFVLETMIGGIPHPRRASLASIRDRDGCLIDTGLAIFFAAPRSFTGEDVAELQCHGSRAVVARVLDVLGSFSGCRPSEPGEFSLRAFRNGRIDLTEAEGLADLIDAETEAQRRLALQGSGGERQVLYNDWYQTLLQQRALVEAELDFSDEGDVPGSVQDLVWQRLAGLRAEILAHAGRFRQAEIIREGFRVVIIGPPNAGKSSLLNALAKRDVAIVTPVAGTTRDLIEVALDLNGMKVLLTDTAGLRETGDAVEAIGIERALEAAGKADLVLSLAEPGAAFVHPAPDVPVILVRTKVDLGMSVEPAEVAISVLDGCSLETLLERIERHAVEAVRHEGLLPSRLRHVRHLNEGADAIADALDGTGLPLEVRAEHLRIAASALASIIGRQGTEDVLGEIFSRFCIGK